MSTRDRARRHELRLLATSRPGIVERRYGRGVLIPAYARLRVVLA